MRFHGISRFRRIFQSLPVQLVISSSTILLLVSAIAVGGFLWLRSLQEDAQATMEEASRARDLSLAAEKEFLLARASEAEFLAGWRTVGYEEASLRYAAANQVHLEAARTQLRALGELAENSRDAVLRSMAEDIQELDPLLETYSAAFQQTLDNIAERERPDGPERTMREKMDRLEAAVSPLANPEFHKRVLQMRANEQAYLASRRQEYVDNARLLVSRFISLVKQSTAADLAMGTMSASELAAEAESYLAAFTQLVNLEGGIDIHTAVFREVTADIGQVTARIAGKSETGMANARMRLQEAGRQSTSTMILVAGLGLALGAAATVLLARQITRPIIRLSQAAQEIGRGNLVQVAPTRANNELAGLTEAFNTMVGQLRQTLGSLAQWREKEQATVQRYSDYMAGVARGNLAARLALTVDPQGEEDPLVLLGQNLNETVAGLQTITRQVRDTASSLADSISEILAAATQQASGAAEQSSAIVQVTTTIDEVRTIAEQNAQRARSVADLARQTAEVARAGLQAAADTAAGMEVIKNRVATIADTILALREEAQTIGQIITTVGEIAAQSNMLALNAAVEAARAGAAGKGFAVVANEVRALAEQSRAAAEQVQGILIGIQRRVDLAFKATEAGRQETEAGMRLTQEAGLSIRRLGESVTASAEAAAQIAASASQQVTGMEQIALAMQNINQVTAQTLSSTRQLEQAAEKLNDLAGRLRQVVQQYEL